MRSAAVRISLMRTGLSNHYSSMTDVAMTALADKPILLLETISMRRGPPSWTDDDDLTVPLKLLCTVCMSAL